MAGQAELTRKEEGTGFGGVSLIFLGAPNLVSLETQKQNKSSHFPKKKQKQENLPCKRKLLAVFTLRTVLWVTEFPGVSWELCGAWC